MSSNFMAKGLVLLLTAAMLVVISSMNIASSVYGEPPDDYGLEPDETRSSRADTRSIAFIYSTGYYNAEQFQYKGHGHNGV